MIIDGRAIAKDILTSVRVQLGEAGITPVLRAVVVQPSAVTESYLHIKSVQATDAGIKMDIVRVSEDATLDEVIAAIHAPGADSVIVQLPLPVLMDTRRILDEIPPEKDPDILSSEAYMAFEEGREGALLPPVTESIKEVLERSKVNVKGMRAVVIGAGRLVGKPATAWLTRMGADVSVRTRDSADMSAVATADILVLGAGSPGLITPEQLKPGVVLIDAGTSESSGAIVGDAAPGCAEMTSVFTPVPGGIGPISVACLFKNVATLALRPFAK